MSAGVVRGQSSAHDGWFLTGLFAVGLKKTGAEWRFEDAVAGADTVVGVVVAVVAGAAAGADEERMEGPERSLYTSTHDNFPLISHTCFDIRWTLF